MQLSKVKDQIWDTLFNNYFGMDSLRINFQEATNKRYFWRSRWLPLILVLLRINFFIGKCRSRINVLSKMGLFVTARLRFQLKLLTNVKKNSILGAARVLGLPLMFLKYQFFTRFPASRFWSKQVSWTFKYLLYDSFSGWKNNFYIRFSLMFIIIIIIIIIILKFVE